MAAHCTRCNFKHDRPVGNRCNRGRPGLLYHTGISSYMSTYAHPALPQYSAPSVQSSWMSLHPRPSLNMPYRPMITPPCSPDQPQTAAQTQNKEGHPRYSTALHSMGLISTSPTKEKPQIWHYMQQTKRRSSITRKRWAGDFWPIQSTR